MKKIFLPLLLSLLLTACGGGGSSTGAVFTPAPSVSSPTPTPTPPAPSVIASPASLANVCTQAGEKSWVRAHLNDVYLWYNEIVDVTPTAYPSVEDYFDALLVKGKDRFSFVSEQSEITQYFQAGQEVGYGAHFVNVQDRLYVSYVEPGSPAALQNVTRGVEIVAINGVARADMSLDARVAALYPGALATTNQFTVRDVGASGTRIVSLTSTTITKSPVLAPKIITTANNRKVGYFAFTAHVATAEDPLIAAFTDFKQNGVDDLVLDVRYNGGGYLYIANEVASMIAGSVTENHVFEHLLFNDKHPEKVSDPASTMNFFPVTFGNVTFSQLNLPRVFVLTGPGTCSASESIINSLLPFVQVITIGGTSCGKPYGMIQKNNCGKAYFAIEFKGVNDAGFGDYANGIAPACTADDDLNHALGDSAERVLATALSYSDAGSCPTAGASNARAAMSEPVQVREVYRAPWRELAIP